MSTLNRWGLILTMAALATAPLHAEEGILERTGDAFARIAEATLPAVVSIRVETTVEVANRYSRNPFEEFFGRSYGLPQQPEPRRYSQQGQGSGFLISKDGYLLTNNHVVNEADRIEVVLHDGRSFSAKQVGTDPKSEVAVLKIEADTDLPFLPLGDSDALRVGEWVLAAGSPFGLTQSVTAGIVSAKGRDEPGIAEYGSFIQTDAAINPGNSGGPLLNIRGEVIGINTAIYTRTGGYMGIGFAIPINLARTIKDQLIEHGHVARSVIGVYIQELDADLAEGFGLEMVDGVLISGVMDGSAAEEAGLKGGDVIVALNGEKTGAMAAFRNRIAAFPPNTTIELEIVRDGAKPQRIKVVTRAMDDPASGNAPAVEEKLGLSIEALDEATAQQLGYDPDAGVVVVGVEPGSPAWRAGVRRGQVIASVNRQRIASVQAFRNEVADAGPIVVLLVREGAYARYLVLRLE